MKLNVHYFVQNHLYLHGILEGLKVLRQKMNGDPQFHIFKVKYLKIFY